MTQLQEGLISKTGDLFYAFRFLKLLVTPFNKTKAFELGILDKDGKNLKKAKTLKTPEEKSAYTVFHRLVFNIKRLLEKLPFGKSRLASYATALFLIREHTGLSERQIKKIMSEVLDDMDWDMIEESSWFTSDNNLNPGSYVLLNDVVSLNTGEVIARKNSRIKVNDFTKPYATIFGHHIYEVYHPLTNQNLYINNGDITR